RFTRSPTSSMRQRSRSRESEMNYRYRITVEALTGAKGEPVEGRTLTFDASNHDDIVGIAEKMRARLPFDAHTIAALGVGLKVFSEVALMHRHDPVVASL